MSELNCPLDDATLIEAVMTMNAELARTGAKTWTMHIPVDLKRDSDVLISEVARRFRDALRERDEARALAVKLAEACHAAAAYLDDDDPACLESHTRGIIKGALDASDASGYVPVGNLVCPKCYGVTLRNQARCSCCGEALHG